jgi:hypothetical protein
MVGDGEAQAVLARQLAVDSDDVLPGADLDRVPVVEAGVVVIEVVVVVGQRGEVLCAGGDVEIHQLFGLPVLGLPEVVHLHPSNLGGMAVGLQVIVVLTVALDVHVAGVPVSLLGDALGGPVVPDAELGVAEPFGRGAGGQRLPCGLEWAGGDVDGLVQTLRDGRGLSKKLAGGEPGGEGRGGCGGEGGLKQAATGESGCGHGGDDRRRARAWARRTK